MMIQVVFTRTDTIHYCNILSGVLQDLYIAEENFFQLGLQRYVEQVPLFDLPFEFAVEYVSQILASGPHELRYPFQP